MRHGRMSAAVVMSMLWLTVSGLGGDIVTPTESMAGGEEKPSEASTTSEATSTSKAGGAKQSDQQSVQSRGLFQKKKKKRVGGSAGHSQPSERTDPTTQEGAGLGK